MMSVFLVANTLLLMNFLETFNHAAFLLINADHDAHPLCIAMAIFLAEYLIVLFFVGLLAYLCVHHRRNWRVWALVAGSILLAVGITYLLRKGWYHPRPFTLPLGNQFLQHSTSSSLPSKHLTSVAAACAGLWLLPVSRLMSVLAAVTVALVAWSPGRGFIWVCIGRWTCWLPAWSAVCRHGPSRAASPHGRPSGSGGVKSGLECRCSAIFPHRPSAKGITGRYPLYNPPMSRDNMERNGRCRLWEPPSLQVPAK